MKNVLKWVGFVVLTFSVGFIVVAGIIYTSKSPEQKHAEAQAEFDKLLARQEENSFLEKYNLLGAPKILYMCNGTTGYSAGIGMNATYNYIVSEAQKKCGGSFHILKSQQ